MRTTGHAPTVFVTYARGVPEHEEKVLSFVNYLRNNGFDAENDKILQQKETSVEFLDMMLKGLSREKVIVVLSESYKTKSLLEGTGVYREYHYILKDIEKEKNKYIFVVFAKPPDYSHIAPSWIDSRDIIDVTEVKGINLLFAKLLGDTVIPACPIGDTLPEVSKEQVPDFDLFIKKN